MFHVNLIDNDHIDNTNWNTAIYVRISEEENNKSINDSIENQKEILSEYATVHKLSVYGIYADDGVRGGSFDRPAFKNMIKDIDNGHINCVLVKDLSRFGREHIDTDHYLERYFPEKGVRFISVIQGLDSVADPHRMNSIEVPMLNIFNEQYLRQVSNSTKASLMMKRKEGKFVGSLVPYGYIRDTNDKHHLIVDQDTYNIVKGIFKQFVEYSSLSGMATRLNSKGILSPSAYRQSKHGKEISDKKWNHNTIKRILIQEIYTGNMIQGKTYSYNCKVNKREPLPREKWDIVENTHEAIIDKIIFDEVQILLSRNSKPKRNTIKKNTPSIFSGFLVCNDCGKKMVRNVAYYKNELGEKVSYNRYVCSTSKKYGSKQCGSHLMREDTLRDILLDVIDTMINSIIDVSGMMEKSKKKKINDQIGKLENQLYKLEQTITKYNTRITGLYSDYKDDIITLAEYKDMKEYFTVEKEEYENQHDNIKRNISVLETGEADYSEGIKNCLSFKGIKDINRHVLATLVDEIYIDSEKNITINFKFKDELKQYITLNY